MAKTTPNLGFYEKEPLVDGSDVFNIQTMINNNLDKLDHLLAVLAGNKTLANYVTQRLESYVAVGEKGSANGVATLNQSGRVPESQLPDLSYIPLNQKGVSYGVATLDSNGKLPDAQAPMRIRSKMYTGTGTLSHSIFFEEGFVPKILFLVAPRGCATCCIKKDSTSGITVALFSTTMATDPSQNQAYYLPLFYEPENIFSVRIWAQTDSAEYAFNKSGTRYQVTAIG